MRLRLQMILAVVLTTITSTGAYGQAMYSFDTTEDFFAPAAYWSAWQDTLDRHHLEREAIHRCLGDEETCSRRLKGLRHILLKGAGLEREQQIRLVNRYINKHALKWTTDFGYGFNYVSDQFDSSGAGWRSDVVGQDGQYVIRTQFQLLF